MTGTRPVSVGLAALSLALAASGSAQAGPFRTSPMSHRVSADGVPYFVRAPDPTVRGPHPLLLGVSGSEGVETFRGLYRLYARETSAYVVVAVGGPDVRGRDGAERLRTILAEVAAEHDLDPERQMLHANSLGTGPALDLAFDLEQERFAAIWVSAPIRKAVPARTAARLGFTPAFGVAWGEEASSDSRHASDLLRAAKQAGYATTAFPRPGPHAPEAPAPEWAEMFDLFARSARSASAGP